MDKAEKVRENRARRAAHRQGLSLTKSSKRDPRAIDYRRWFITDEETGQLVADCDPRRGMTLGDVEAYLNRPITDDDRGTSPRVA